MKHLLIILSMGLLFGLFLGGCKENIVDPRGDQPPPGVTNEETAMKVMAVNDEFVRNDEQTFDDKEVEPEDYGTFGKVLADITPLRFGRIITSITRTVTVTVQPGDSMAIALVAKDIIGVFKIRAINTTGDTILVEKPFNDHSTRKVIFKRVQRETRRYWLNWIPIATSLVDGGTVAPNNLIDISKVEMFLPNGDTITVTEPNEYFLRYKWITGWHFGRRDLPVFLPGQEVKLRVTLTSASADTDFVALRFGFDMFHKRRAHLQIVSEVNNGDGTYTRVYEKTWLTHPHPGYFHAGVDAMTKGTVHNDTEPYSVSWWGIPYRVVLL
jgi:hypothetical protein